MTTQAVEKQQTTTALEQVKGTGHLAKSPQLTLVEIRELGDIFFASGMFEDVKNVAQAMVKIKAGEELGFTPFVSMGGVHVIKGKPSLGATLQASLLKDSPRYRYEVVELSDQAVELAFYEKIGTEWKRSGNSRFTMEDAKAAKLAGQGGSNQAMYDKYSRNMLFARSLTNGMRWYTPDLLRCADGYSEPEADFNLDEVISETSETAAADVPDHVDGEVVEDAVTKTPEEVRTEKVDHVQQLCKWLNEHGDSIEWKASTLANYINHMFDVDDGIRSLDFESLDKLIADLTERLEALTKAEKE
jgi:hypothetical protein